MNYKSLHDYIKDTVAGLKYSTTFFHGRTPNAQQVRGKESVFVQLLPINATASFTTNNVYDKIYNVQIAIYQQDRPDTGINRNKGAETDSKEMQILEVTDYIADDLIRKISDNDVSPTLQHMSDLIVLSSISIDRAIKDTSAYLTGTVVSFNIQVPDQFDYCCD